MVVPRGMFCQIGSGVSVYICGAITECVWTLADLCLVADSFEGCCMHMTFSLKFFQ